MAYHITYYIFLQSEFFPFCLALFYCIILALFLLPVCDILGITHFLEAFFMKAKHINTKKIVLTALFAALTVQGSALRITVPLDIAGTSSFHLGNILCALSGILLGPWFGGLAAGLGSAIYDILNPLYISECWITFLMKGIYGLVAGLIAWKGNSYGRMILAALGGALSYALLYLSKSYFYSGLLLAGLTPEAALLNVFTKLPATIFNAVVAVICAPLLAIAIKKALSKCHLSLN